MVKIQEAENQIVIHCEVFDQRPSDSDLLTPSIEKHKELLNRVPDLAAADAGFFSAANEAAGQTTGREASSRSQPFHQKVKNANRSRRSVGSRKLRKWRTGCEGRISVLKRRHGLNRSRYKGTPGMKRWVGLGVLADNMINIGLHMASKR